MIVTADHGGGLKPGDEILQVNGIPAKAMLAELMLYTRVDGGNDGKRRIQLSVQGADEIEYFDVFHGLVFGAAAGGVHRLTVRDGEGRRHVEAPAIGLSARQSFRPAQPSDGSLGWTWQVRNDGIAVVTMGTWATYNTKWDWRAWLHERLDSLGGARGLIVDLRENEGGKDCGDEILARFLARDLPGEAERRLVRFRTTREGLRPHLDTWDKSFHTLGEKADRHDDRFFVLPPAGDEAIVARGPRLDLPLAVLIGPQNSSATFRFAQVCRRAGVGTLIGEPTGGNQRGINGGCYFFVRLPASGLEFDLPLIGYFPLRPKPDAGLRPDLLVPQTARDIAAGRDRAMEAAIAMMA
jgi:hypothetical protein